jgi:hypothetical protein
MLISVNICANAWFWELQQRLTVKNIAVADIAVGTTTQVPEAESPSEVTLVAGLCKDADVYLVDETSILPQESELPWRSAPHVFGSVDEVVAYYNSERVQDTELSRNRVAFDGLVASKDENPEVAADLTMPEIEDVPTEDHV